MLAWFALNSIFAVLFFTGVIGKPELVLLTSIYFLCDYICILLFCPFQTFGQKDKCCVNCRIYDWGHFFMFTPCLFLNSFFGWTLFLMGTAVIVTWEFEWTFHPERFWEGSNQVLKCENCKDQTCTVKRRNTKAILSLLKKWVSRVLWSDAAGVAEEKIHVIYPKIKKNSHNTRYELTPKS